VLFLVLSGAVIQMQLSPVVPLATAARTMPDVHVDVGGRVDVSVGVGVSAGGVYCRAPGDCIGDGIN
jgi:hypothetical protein